MSFPGKTVCLAALLLTLAPLGSACSWAGRRPAETLPISGGWLLYLNYYRATAGLAPVTENAAWSDGDRKHAIYTIKNEVLQHGEDPENTWYTPEGQAAARQSNLAHSSDKNDTDRWAIDAWMQSPFHAVGVLDPRLLQVGYGSHREAAGNVQMAAGLNVIAGIQFTAGAVYPVFWPGNGTTVPIGLHWGERPSPLTSCPGYSLPSGLPLIVQIGPGHLTPVVSATSFTRDGQALEHCVFDESTYRNPDHSQQNLGRAILGARDAIVLIPRLPLSAGASYTASITVDGRTHTWSFGVDGASLVQQSKYIPGSVR